MTNTEPKLDAEVSVVRAFSRVYSERVGALGQNIYDTPFSMTEMRVIYEVHEAKSTTARDLCLILDLDGGYLSRILHRLEEHDIVTKKASKTDARRREITLTNKGKKAYHEWAERTNTRIREMLDSLVHHDREQLLKSLRSAAETLTESKKVRKGFTLRSHKPGDMGLIIHSHAVQFARDYGWNNEFEALVAEKTSDFIRNFDPRYDFCCVADMGGDLVGSVFIVKVNEEEGELRLLFVDPRARGLGVGMEMLDEAIKFATNAKYKKLSMWTESISTRGAKIFQTVGFKIVKETPHHRFGHNLVGQYWEKTL